MSNYPSFPGLPFVNPRHVVAVIPDGADTEVRTVDGSRFGVKQRPEVVADAIRQALYDLDHIQTNC